MLHARPGQSVGVILPSLPIAVDYWKCGEGIQHYFLSHMHGDHYSGLTPTWTGGRFYCSEITKRLVLDKFRGFDESLITVLTVGETLTIPLVDNAPVASNNDRSLRAVYPPDPHSVSMDRLRQPLNLEAAAGPMLHQQSSGTQSGPLSHSPSRGTRISKPIVIDDDEDDGTVDLIDNGTDPDVAGPGHSARATGVEVRSVNVTAFDANHCPGAVMLLFESDLGRILHTGDFRFTPRMFTEEPALARGRFDLLFLDNTFNHPACSFPSQQEGLARAAAIIGAHPPEVRVIIGIDGLGKEEFVVALARKFQARVFVSPERYRWLQLCEQDMRYFTTDESEARFHVYSRRSVTKSNAYRWNRERPTISLVASGWAGVQQLPDKISFMSGFTEVDQVELSAQIASTSDLHHAPDSEHSPLPGVDYKPPDDFHSFSNVRGGGPDLDRLEEGTGDSTLAVVFDDSDTHAPKEVDLFSTDSSDDDAAAPRPQREDVAPAAATATAVSKSRAVQPADRPLPSSPVGHDDVPFTRSAEQQSSPSLVGRPAAADRSPSMGWGGRETLAADNGLPSLIFSPHRLLAHAVDATESDHSECIDGAVAHASKSRSKDMDTDTENRDPGHASGSSADSKILAFSCDTEELMATQSSQHSGSPLSGASSSRAVLAKKRPTEPPPSDCEDGGGLHPQPLDTGNGGRIDATAAGLLDGGSGAGGRERPKTTASNKKRSDSRKLTSASSAAILRRGKQIASRKMSSSTEQAVVDKIVRILTNRNSSDGGQKHANKRSGGGSDELLLADLSTRYKSVYGESLKQSVPRRNVRTFFRRHRTVFTMREVKQDTVFIGLQQCSSNSVDASSHPDDPTQVTDADCLPTLTQSAKMSKKSNRVSAPSKRAVPMSAIESRVQQTLDGRSIASTGQKGKAKGAANQSDALKPKANRKRLRLRRVLYRVPYSLHSSYTELVEFVRLARPVNIIGITDNYTDMSHFAPFLAPRDPDSGNLLYRGGREKLKSAVSVATATAETSNQRKRQAPPRSVFSFDHHRPATRRRAKRKGALIASRPLPASSDRQGPSTSDQRDIVDAAPTNAGEAANAAAVQSIQPVSAEVTSPASPTSFGAVTNNSIVISPANSDAQNATCPSSPRSETDALLLLAEQFEKE